MAETLTLERPAAADTDDELASLVLERWEKGDRHLRRARRDFWLNYAFYEGNQWVWWDTQTRTVQMLPERFYETERVRLTINKFESRIDTLLGKLCERDLDFEGEPSSADDQSLAGAHLAESILEAARVANDWESIREETIFNALMGGTAAVAVEWDGDGGERLWVDESNQKITGTGEVSLSPLSIAEFSLQAGSRRFESSNWWIGSTAVPPEQAREKYALSWTPRPDSTRAYSPLQRKLMDAEASKDLVSVYVMYERPNSRCKKGRRVVVINGTTVVSEVWNLPFEELNLQIFRQGRVSMRWFGKTFVSAARPVQVAYNAVRSNIAEHIKLAGNARLWVPNGALDDTGVLTDEPGEIVEYYAEAGQPHYEVPPGMQRSTLEEAQRLEAELDDILHAHDVSRGVAPGDRNSGLALSILAEKNDTPLGPMSRDQARGWARVAGLVLQLYEDRATETRTAVVPSESGVPRKHRWSGRDLRGQTEVRVPLEATAPHSRAQMLGMLTQVKQMFPEQMPQIPMGTIARLLQLPNSKALSMALDDDAAKAMRENDFMSTEEVCLVAPWDDHAKHIAEHNRFRNSSTFEQLDDDIKKMIDAHVKAHQRLAQEEVAGQAQLNAIRPGLGALPQAHEPIGSAVPEDFATIQGQGNAA